MIPRAYLRDDWCRHGEVTAVVGDRLVALQVDEGLPAPPPAADRARRRAPAGAGGGHAAGASPAPMRERHIDKDP